MKTYIFSFLILVSFQASAQVTSQRSLELSLRWFPTPQAAADFISYVRPKDAADVKEFIQKSGIKPGQSFPLVQIEGNRLLVAGLNEPILWTKNGTYTFKKARYKYDPHLSFKKNLLAFDKHWGPFREFGVRHKQALWQQLVMPSAFAQDLSDGWRWLLLIMASNSEIPQQLNEFANELYDNPPAPSSKSSDGKGPQIQCDNPSTYRQGDYLLKVAPQDNYSKAQVQFVSHPGDKKLEKTWSDNFIILRDGDGSIAKVQRLCAHSTDSCENESPNASGKGYVPAEHIEALEDIVQTVMTECQPKAQDEYNLTSQRATEYEQQHHLTADTKAPQPKPEPLQEKGRY